MEELAQKLGLSKPIEMVSFCQESDSPVPPPGDLISREAVVKLLDEWVKPLDGKTPVRGVAYNAGYNAALLDARRAIQSSGILPAADAAPTQHGRWILDSYDEYASHYSCSRCGAEIDLCNEICSEPTPEYCQHCGSRMDEGKETE